MSKKVIGKHQDAHVGNRQKKNECTTRCFFYKQPVYKQLGLRFFENNNRIQWSIVMLNNGEQNKF